MGDLIKEMYGDVEIKEEMREKILDGMSKWKKSARPLLMYLEVCSKCGACAEVCGMYQASPKKELNPAYRANLIRKIYKGHFTLSGKLLGELVGAEKMDGVDTIKTWAQRLWECSMCRRCAQYCPFGIDNAVIVRAGRSLLNSIDLVPKMLYKTREAVKRTGNNDGMEKPAFLNMIGFLKDELKEETGKDIDIPLDVEGADYLYIPPSVEIHAYADTLMGVAKMFHAAGANWTMSSTVFDSANCSLFIGDDATMKWRNKRMVEEVIRLKAKNLVIGECGHAYRVQKMFSDKWYGPFPFETLHITEVAADFIKKGKIDVDPSANPGPVTFHDSCNLARSCGIVEAPRTVLNAVTEEFIEMEPNGVNNYCCGGGGGLVMIEEIKDYRMNVAGKLKVEQIRETGAKQVVATCANCKKQISELIEYHKLDTELIGLMELVGNALVL
jgi:Fe-S oxidoreductase